MERPFSDNYFFDMEVSVPYVYTKGSGEVVYIPANLIEAFKALERELFPWRFEADGTKVEV